MKNPGGDGYFVGGSIDVGCAPVNLNFFGTEDFYGHGTRVASVIAGYDTSTNNSVLSIYSTIETQVFSIFFDCPGTGSVTNHFVIPTEPCALVTDIIFSCTSAGVVPMLLPLPTEIIVTQVVDFVSQDPSGFQLGMGVSPFGRIGISRIWRQTADTTGNPPHVRFLPNPQSTIPCMDGLYPVLFFSAYSDGGRIQNDSWSDLINTNGSNGGFYSADSQTYDIGVRDALLAGNLGNGGNTNGTPGPSPLNQEFIVVFTLGNSLLSDAGVRGNNGGFGDLRITPPATAKNVITVTASESVRLDGSGCAGNSDQDNSFDMWESSAFGPALDGRFKPRDCLAPAPPSMLRSHCWRAAVDPVLGIIPDLIAEDPNWELLAGNQSLFGFTITNLYCAPPEFFEAFFPNTSETIVAPGPSGLAYDCDSGSSYAAPAVSGAIQLLWWYFQHRLADELGTAELLRNLKPGDGQGLRLQLGALPVDYQSGDRSQGHAAFHRPGHGRIGFGAENVRFRFPWVIRDESTPRAIDVALITTKSGSATDILQPVRSTELHEVSGQVFDPTKALLVSVWRGPMRRRVPSAAKELVK